MDTDYKIFSSIISIFKIFRYDLKKQEFYGKA